MRLADYVLNFISNQLGVKDIFTVTGGGAMFLNDACAKQSNIRTICVHHEQAAAMAAVAYSKYNNNFSSAIFTTGCGATNAITGLLDAWQDNTPCFFISGQVKRKETSHNSEIKELRQFGVQEANIIKVVEPLTKYSVMINDPLSIRYHLEKAAYLAKSGRPGPVWIDIPLDVQGAEIDIKKIKPYKQQVLKKSNNQNKILALSDAIKKSQRPIVIAGNGIRLSDTTSQFREFIKINKIPFVTSYLSSDLLNSYNDLNIGKIGIKGDRAANFAMQNSDLVIALGTRLSVALTGFEYELFAREAKLFVVDIHKNEHKKNTVKIHKLIEMDLRDFFVEIKKFLSTVSNNTEWRKTVVSWKKQWSIFNEPMVKSKKINKYTFMKKLNEVTKGDEIIVSDAGSSYYVTSQAVYIKKNQRYITSGAQADMGFTIPAAIGACFASKNKKNILAITGDGSLQMNIQELQTIFHHKLNLKLIVFNNDGYLSIKTTQEKFFNGRLIGTNPSSGISFPSLKKIAGAYGIKYSKLSSNSDLSRLVNLFNIKGPIIIEVMNPPNQEIIPTASSKRLPDGRMISKPLEDMYPFLDRDVFFKNMIIDPLEE